MKKKNVADNSEEENEFDVDEPEAIQNNASDDDWTPDKAGSGGRRTSTRLRNIPKSRAPIIDASSSDEGSDSEGKKRKGKGRGRTPAKKPRVSSTSTPPAKAKSDTSMSAAKSVSSDSEPTSTTANNSSTAASPVSARANKDFSSGAFIVLKTDAAKLDEDPPLWKIDGKALLQKYIPFQEDGKTLYKNTSVYSGWTINNRNNYFPVTVIFKQQTRKDHIVEFKRDQIKKEDLENVGKETDNDSKNGNAQVEEDDDDEDEDEDMDENEDEENEDEEEENEDEENEEDEEGGDNEEGGDKNGEKNGDTEDSEVKKEKEDDAEVKKEKE